MTVEKITDVMLRQKFYEHLRAKILDAEFLPAEIINLQGLADKFGVSILQAMHKHVGINHKAYIRQSDQFHAAISAYTESSLLIELNQHLLARVNPYIYPYSANERDLTGDLECHLEVFASFSNRDSKRATADLLRDYDGDGNEPLGIAMPAMTIIM